MADESESFKSKTILGLLRSAPDLLPNIKNVEDMYVKPVSDKGEPRHDGGVPVVHSLTPSFSIPLDADELLPQAGKDETYDEIMAEIDGLEEDLAKELKRLEKKLGWDGSRFC